MLQKIIMILVLSVTFAVPLKAQLIKYITYYPIPSVTHSQLKVSDKTMLATSSGGVVEIGSVDVDESGLVTSSFNANRVVLSSYAAPEGKPNLIVGNTDGAALPSMTGRLKVFGNVNTGWPSVDEIVAQGIMSVAGVTWRNKGGFGFDVSNNPNAWQACSKGQTLMWRQIKMMGSDEYRTYLVCGNLIDMPEPVCDPNIYKCVSPLVLQGSPVRQDCRCVEDCSRRTDGRVYEKEGGVCCFRDQVVKDGPTGKYCTYRFTQEHVYADAITPPIGGIYKVRPPSEKTCYPDYSEIKFYKKGGRKVELGSNDNHSHHQTGWCAGCYGNNSVYLAGWSGIQIERCPDTDIDICDTLCDFDTRGCDKYCYKDSQTKPTINNTTSYYYSTWEWHGNCAPFMDNCRYTNGTSSSKDRENSTTRRCAFLFTSQAVVTHCKNI